MRGGRKFKGSDFRGGDASLPPLSVSTKVSGLSDPEVRPYLSGDFVNEAKKLGVQINPRVVHLVPDEVLAKILNCQRVGESVKR